MARIRARMGTVVTVKSQANAVEQLEVQVEGAQAVALNYPDLTGPAAPGDQVLLNTTEAHLAADDLPPHMVMANLTRPETDLNGAGHLLKLRHTPWQLRAHAAEERDSPHRRLLTGRADLQRMPVVVGSAHEQLPAIAAGIKSQAPDARVAYIMTQGAALPLAASTLVPELRRARLVDATITCGQAFGGDYEAVNVHSALHVARSVVRADAAICCMGPGGAETGMFLGFAGMESLDAILAAEDLGADVIAALRISFADPRQEHRGLSEHSIAALRHLLMLASVPIPILPHEQQAMVTTTAARWGLGLVPWNRVLVEGEPALDLLAERGVRPTVMGRSVDEDQAFFLAAGAAGVLAGRRLSGEAPEPEDVGDRSELSEDVVGTDMKYRGRILSVRVDTVRLSDGSTATREVVEHADAVTVVALAENDEVVLVRQFRLPAGQVLLETPAGVVEPGEQPTAAAQRELAEEAGMRAGRLEPVLSMYLAPGYSEEKMHVFLGAELVPAERRADEDEIIEVERVPLAEVAQMCLDGRIEDAKTVAGILAVLRLREMAGKTRA